MEVHIAVYQVSLSVINLNKETKEELPIVHKEGKAKDAGLDVTYESIWRQYRVKFGGFDDSNFPFVGDSSR